MNKSFKHIIENIWKEFSTYLGKIFYKMALNKYKKVLFMPILEYPTKGGPVSVSNAIKVLSKFLIHVISSADTTKEKNKFIKIFLILQIYPLRK